MVKPTEPAGNESVERPEVDPDSDPANLNPRDTREDEAYEGDPDADPGNLNPRDPGA